MTTGHSILYTADSVRAYLEDRKTQTRRVIKPQPTRTPIANSADSLYWYMPKPNTYERDMVKCPYGQIGDRLWVRETLIKSGHAQAIALYKADNSSVKRVSDDGSTRMVFDWDWERDTLPSIFMPRWASRLTQTITEVRVERLADLTEEDAVAEGVETDSWQTTHGWKNYVNPGCIATTARTSYESLWNKLNRQRGYGWESNVWVWVISYPKYSEEPTRTGNAKTNNT